MDFGIITEKNIWHKVKVDFYNTLKIPIIIQDIHFKSSNPDFEIVMTSNHY